MNKERLREILQTRFTMVLTDSHWDEKAKTLAIEAALLGVDDAVDAILKEIGREEQLAILPCGHSAVWADENGCKACEYEKRITSLEDTIHAIQPIR